MPTSMSDDAPVVQVVDRHPHPGHPRPRLRRPHRAGRRHRADPLPRRRRAQGDPPAARVMGPGLVSRIKIMAGMNIVERRRPQDGQLTTTIDGKDVDVRVATVATIAGESCVMRVLDKTRSRLPARRPRHAGRHPRHVLQDRPRAVRDDAVRGPDGQREDDDALRDAQRGQQPDAQRHDDRGPGRVRLPLDQPDPDERAGGAHLRHRAEVDPAPGPRRDPGRRDPRRRDGPRRHAVGPDRPLRHLLDARHGLGLGAAPLLGHGDRVVPHRLVGARRRRAAARAADLPVVQDGLHAHERGADVLRGERRARRRRRSSTTAPAATSAAAPASRSGSASTSCSR